MSESARVFDFASTISVDRGVENVRIEIEKPVESTSLASCLKNNHNLTGCNFYPNIHKSELIFFKKNLYTVLFYK